MINANQFPRKHKQEPFIQNLIRIGALVFEANQRGGGGPELVFDSANQFPQTQGPFIQNFIKICQLVGIPPSP